MKIIYQGKEVGLQKNIKKVIDMFGDSIRISSKHVIACKLNNEVKSLNYEIKEGDNVELLDITSKDGMQVYIRGALFITSMAMKQLYPDAKLIVNYQLQNSMFCELLDDKTVTDEMIENLRAKINEIVEKDYPIEKKEMTKQEAEQFFKDNDIKNNNLFGKLQLENKYKDYVSEYFCNGYFNYFYGVMPLSTGYINLIDVCKYKNGFIVRYPNRSNPTEIGEFKDSKKFSATLQEYDQIWNLMKINTVNDINQEIRNGKSKDLVLVSEALQEKKIAELADKITKHRGIKIVLIAGPSSSSKTTFAKRLGVQLRINGINPVTIGTDNYFVERSDTPRDENGNYDFETIEALDLKLFNDHLTKLINGETIEMPTFDFKLGTKKYNGHMLHLDEDEVLIIEGIHSLNDRLTAKIPRKNKFKIYISDLTVLNLDSYNRISTTDTRLVRRIVRDYNFRGYSALQTLERWPSVNAGENKNIFPFQEEADAMFNSSLPYELCVLSKYATPLLKKIDNSHPEYAEAKRIISFLEYFDSMDEKYIPNNSLLREFIGGSIFDYE